MPTGEPHCDPSLAGFTGRLITAYLKDHPERDKFTFAIAGRSREKLNELKRGLSLPDSVQVFTLDVTHAGHVDEVVQVAQVIISTVGPYWKYGNPVVRCVCIVLDLGGSRWVLMRLLSAEHVRAMASDTLTSRGSRIG